jgi:O-antigen/teichoic acid export membrane protein
MTAQASRFSNSQHPTANDGLFEASGLPESSLSSLSGEDETRRHIRGSSMLLFGRLFSLAISTVVQVLIVRYLSKSSYGALAYALTLASVGTSIALFGLDRAINVFVPIYQERRDHDRVFGAMFVIVGTVLLIGLSITLLVYGLHGLIGRKFMTDPQAIALMLILIALVPIQALDGLLVSMFAIFAGARAIFFRRYLLAPGLQLAVAILLVWTRSGVRFLALGYLCAAIIGLIACGLTLVRILRRQDIFRHFNLRTMKMPIRPIFGYAIPLLASDLGWALQGAFVVLLLGRFQGTLDVAAFKAVLPVAVLNLVVFQSFKYLFTPVAARMHARNDNEGLKHLYQQTAIWIAIISFPVFVLTFSLAKPLVLLLYGQRYENSALVLTLLSLGYYLSAALGFNGLTMRVIGKVRYVFTVDLVATIAGLLISLLLVPRYGALGAAISLSSTLIAQNILYQMGLRRSVGVNLLAWQWLRSYLTIALAALGLLLVQLAMSSAIYVSFALAALAVILVLGLSRTSLNIGRTFPEVLRVPVAGRLLRAL